MLGTKAAKRMEGWAVDALGHLQPSGFKVTREGTPVLAGGGWGVEVRSGAGLASAFFVAALEIRGVP